MTTFLRTIDSKRTHYCTPGSMARINVATKLVVRQFFKLLLGRITSVYIPVISHLL